MINNQEIFNQPILKVDTSGIKPAITIKDVDFDGPILVADPFPIYHEGKFFLFYELEGEKKKVIAVSESSNGIDYQWSGVVLDTSSDNTRLSFPYVFKDKDNWYMIPEESEIGTSWSLNYLYKTDNANFPFGWKREGILFDVNEKKRKITDKAIIRHNEMWYVFYGYGDSRKHELNIAMFEDIENRKSIKHPSSPIIQTPTKNLYSEFIFCLSILAYKLRRKGLDVNNSKLLSDLFSKMVSFIKLNPCRPGGKIIKISNGEIIAYLQDQGKKLNHWDIRKSYGRYVSAMIIDKLTPEEIKFKIHDDYIITPTLNEGDWNKERMHTVSPINVNGEIFVAVDGLNGYKNEWSIAVVKI